MTDHLSPSLNAAADQAWQRLAEQAPDALQLWQTASHRPLLRRALALSEFIADTLLRQPTLLHELYHQPPAYGHEQEYAALLQQQLQAVSDEAGLMQALRRFRHAELVRIAWLQIHGQPDLMPPEEAVLTEQTLRQLSALAESLIVGARDWLYQSCCREWGTPVNADGKAQPLLILGMGKLGGAELNFSSDIDLILAYPENGQTSGGRRALDNAQFFTRLGQRLIKALDQPTVDGFVYRVDMRLRPFGESGPLVMSYPALEDYYQEQGRDWERYAMIKARVMGDDSGEYAAELKQMLRPFVFRRYIDFSVIQSLRTMKGMIAREVRRRGLVDNIKLGAGGIREIEFIAQVFQLIRGGREPSLQGRSLLPTLQAIGQLGLLQPSEVDGLCQAYLYLRRLENGLQAIRDEQTQTLPSAALDQARLCDLMQAAQWSALQATLEHHMQAVRAVFAHLIGEEEDSASEEPQLQLYQDLWLGRLSAEESLRLCPASPDEEVAGAKLLRVVEDFHREVDKRTLGPRGREVLNRLMPRLLSACLSHPHAALLLPRIIHLMSRIVTRTTYLELLAEHPTVLTHLLTLCTASPWVAEQLALYPLLLDELLDPQTLYHPLPLTQYRDELRQYLLRVPEEDEEQQMEALRQFKQAHLLRIAAADIVGALPLMKVSDHLTYLAEAIIDAVVRQAWRQMTARYGEPQHLAERGGQGFAVLGYGKLGGWELGYGSDLDLVFLIDCPPEVVTSGERSIDGRQFYLRLAQRIMHLFATRTSSGVLYEVDTRLRPSGAAGLLVSSLEAFADYQAQEAWTWEHQALVRARMVYGDPMLQAAFAEIRHGILCKERPTEALRQEVLAMRQKMQAHHTHGERSHSESLFDLKADAGGITDIEFIAQYLVLRFAALQPAITEWSDNVRIFELLQRYELMSAAEAQQLTACYCLLRDENHRLALQQLPGKVSATQFTEEREQVMRSWHVWLETPVSVLAD